MNMKPDGRRCMKGFLKMKSYRKKEIHMQIQTVRKREEEGWRDGWRERDRERGEVCVQLCPAK